MSQRSYSTIVCTCGMRIGNNGAARASHRQGKVHARRMEAVRARAFRSKPFPVSSDD